MVEPAPSATEFRPELAAPLPIANVAFLERQLTWLARYGVDEVVLSLGYKPDAFLEAYPDATCSGVRLVYAVEPEPLDRPGCEVLHDHVRGGDQPPHQVVGVGVPLPDPAVEPDQVGIILVDHLVDADQLIAPAEVPDVRDARGEGEIGRAHV